STSMCFAVESVEYSGCNTRMFEGEVVIRCSWLIEFFLPHVPWQKQREGFQLFLVRSAFLYLGSTPCPPRSEEHTSELQSRFVLVCRLLLGLKQIKIL